MTVSELASTHYWNMPTVCPICGAKLDITENDKGKITDLYCTNPHCKSRYIGRINKWTNTIGAKEFGEKRIEDLIDKEIIKDIPDLYKMDLNKIAALDGYGEKSAQNFKKELDSHNHITLSQFIAGFNIPGIGEKVIDKIVDKFGFKNFEDLSSVKSPEYLVCDGVGIKTADKIWEGIQSLIEEMTETLKYVKVYVEEKKTGGLDGMSFCFTGALNTMKRAEAEKLVVDHGGEVKSGVSKGLTYLVTNTPDSGSSKNVKAAQLGTTLITEEQFLKLING